MKQMWENLSAGTKRKVVIAGAVGILGVAVFMTPERELSSRKSDESVTTVLGADRDNVDRIDQLIAQIENLREENQEVLVQVDRLKTEIQQKDDESLNTRVSKDLEEMLSRIADLEADVNGYDNEDRRTENSNGETVVNVGGQSQIEEPTDNGGVRELDLSKPKQTNTDSETEVESVEANDTIWRRQVISKPAPAVEDQPKTGGSTQQAEPVEQKTSTIRFISSDAGEVEEEAVEVVEDEALAMILPAGSIITGTLVTGMDAPTGASARAEPFPAVLRVKEEAILPNRYRADIKECFIIMGGYGDLSSERAYMRGETLSCVTEDKKVIETSLDSYVVGEDGKAGLRGRVVTKQGQILAKAAMSDMLSQFSSVLGSSNSIDISELSPVEAMKSMFSTESVTSALGAGAASAMDRISEFYISIVDGMYPVIEIDAGRKVDMILKSGLTLDPK